MADTMISAGGGLSKTKLALANAAESDVLSGKKFYAGDKIIKEGRMPNRGSWGTTINPGGVATIPAGHHNGSGKVVSAGIKTTDVWQSCRGGHNSFSFTGGTLVGIQYAGDPNSGENSLQAAGISGGSTYWAQCAANTSASVHFTLAYY